MSGKVGEMHKGTRAENPRLGEQELGQVERGSMAEEASGLCGAERVLHCSAWRPCKATLRYAVENFLDNRIIVRVTLRFLAKMCTRCLLPSNKVTLRL